MNKEEYYDEYLDMFNDDIKAAEQYLEKLKKALVRVTELIPDIDSHFDRCEAQLVTYELLSRIDKLSEDIFQKV